MQGARRVNALQPRVDDQDGLAPHPIRTGLRADAQHRVSHAPHVLSEYDFEAEGRSVEGDESVQVASHDGDVIESGDGRHADMLRAIGGSGQLPPSLTNTDFGER